MTDTGPDIAPAEPPAAARSARAGVLVLVGTIIALLAWHLAGDRLTPYSNQGRVHANVIGIAPEVGGLVTAVKIRNNQLVTKGQLLFTIARDNYEIAAEKAQADISAVGRDLAAADAGIKAATANVEAARAGLLRSQQDYERSERIYKEDAGAISVRRLEFSRATFVESQAKVTAALAQLDQARQARGLSGDDNDRLVAARSAAAKAALDLKRTSVVAPSDGLVTDLKAETGQFAAPGTPVLTFIAIHDGWVTVDMTENNLGHLKIGDPAEIVLDVAPGQVFRGRLRSMGFGVATGGKTMPGTLPDVQNSRDWLRQAQRFPVIIALDKGQLATIRGIREGGQAEAIFYTGDNPLLNALGRFYIRLMSWLSYAY